MYIQQSTLHYTLCNLEDRQKLKSIALKTFYVYICEKIHISPYYQFLSVKQIAKDLWKSETLDRRKIHTTRKLIEDLKKNEITLPDFKFEIIYENNLISGIKIKRQKQLLPGTSDEITNIIDI